MRLSLCLILLAVVGCSALIPPLSPPCSFGVADEIANHCCNLEAHGFDTDDSMFIRWLRAQIDTPEVDSTLRCEPVHEFTFDTIGRKMSRVGCWGRTIQINGVSFEMLTRYQFIALMQRRHCFPF